MNCIFLCVFAQDKYVEMVFLLLESIFIYGNLNDNTEILIYTSTQFAQMIFNSNLYTSKIKFEINDNYNNIDSACKARLDLFNLQSTSKYNKILYLDTDILIAKDINPVFDIIKEDVLYVTEEGTIEHECWGGNSLFGNELNNYTNKSAFSSGVLLFNNCEKIKKLFESINEDMKNRPCYFATHDQPYIVYNAFKYNLFNNKDLTNYGVNYNHPNINTQNIISYDKIIHHYAGGPGYYIRKLDQMRECLYILKDDTIMNNMNITKIYIDEYLLPIIRNCGELLEGNIFMLHHTTNYTNVFLNKAKNISNLVLNKNIKNVMEIGFNAGFSALLMLFSNPNINITCYDLGEHKYTLPCFNKIKESFGDRINIIIGDSTLTLPNAIGTYDLIHIDGGHSTEVATNDIIHSYRMGKKGTILIMDDYDFQNLHQLWDNYIRIYNLQIPNIMIYNSPHHDIKFII